jgi:hypothetical protein
MRHHVAFAVALLLWSAALSAQETTGAISGRLVDTQGLPLPGVTVTASGPQGTKSSVSDTEGRFTIPFLTPGTYSVRAELSGFAPVERQNLQVRLSQNLDLPLTMQVAGVQETVQVTATPMTIDTTSTTVGATLDSNALARLPVGRRFSDALYLAPGVSSSGTAGTANPSVSGSSGLENQYIVDGINITNQGYGALGSYSIVFGSLGNGTPFDFMQEVQVKTAGYEAEFGQATGGVINVVTKSGTNNVAGSLFAYARPTQFEAAWPDVQSTNGTVNTTGSAVSDAGVTIGAPIVRDHLFAFAAFDPQWETRRLNAPADFPLVSLGAQDRDRRVVNYAAKGTWQVTPAHRVDASFFGDPARGAMGPQRTSSLRNQTTSAYSSLDYGGHNQSARYEGVLSEGWLLEGSFAHALNRISETPSVNEWQVRNRLVTPNVFTGGIGLYEAGNRSANLQWTARATNQIASHQIRYGFQRDHVTYDQVNQRTGPTFVLPTGQQTATGASVEILPDPTFGQIYRVTRANLNAARTTTQHYTALFVQDTWRIGSTLTIRPGLRYEQETLVGTIVDNFTLKNNWAPRIGVTWDPTGTGRAKLFANYGRYYARVPNDLAARALSADQGVGADYFDAALTRPIPDGVPAGPNQTTTHYSIAGAGADVIDPNAKLSYYNEYLGGVEYDLGGTMVGARFIHRDIGRVLEDVTPFPIVAADLGIPGAASVDYLLTNPGPSTPTSGDLGASFENPIHNYNAVEFTIERRLSGHWSTYGSYRFSRLTGNFEGFYRDDNGQSDPGVTSLYDFPTNDPSYTAIGVPQFGYRGDVRFLGALGSGPLPLDRPHQIKLYANYVFDMGLNISAGLNLSSGKPLTALAANPNLNYQNGGEIPETPRGDGFQTSDGFRTRTPFQRDFDAHASYILRLGTKNLVLLADVFNVFNSQTVLDYDNWTESTFGAPNPDFGRAGVSSVIAGQQIQAPRQVRVGARFEF